MRRQRYDDVEAEGFLGNLNDELDDLTRRVENATVRQQVIEKVTIRAAGTAVRHKLGVRPKPPMVTLKGDARWWEYKARDTQYVYLKANADIEAEVILQG